MTQSLGSASVPLGKKPQLHYTKFSREHKIENLLTSPWTEHSEREVGRSTVLLSLNDKGWRLKNVEMLDISFNIDPRDYVFYEAGLASLIVREKLGVSFFSSPL